VTLFHWGLRRQWSQKGWVILLRTQGLNGLQAGGAVGGVNAENEMANLWMSSWFAWEKTWLMRKEYAEVAI